MAHGYAKNGKTTKVRRPDVQLFHPGRHDVLLLASVLLAFPVLDACHIHAWRPTPSHPLFWTPCPSLSGVHPSNLLNFGRLSHPCVASNSISSLILDAPHFLTWRPIPSLPLFWTPCPSLSGVRSFDLPRFGRLPFPYVASISIPSSILDAMSLALWRPSFQLSQFWTPVTSMRGVQFHLILNFGRPSLPYVASISIPFSILDAMSITLWRPSFQPSQFWTPVTSMCGVHFLLFLYSGRLSHQDVASISISSSVPDAMSIALWRPSFQLFPY